MQRETWALLIILLIASAAAFAHATTTIEEYSRHNIGWNGTSNLGLEEIHDLSKIPTGATLLILAPEKPFTEEEVDCLRALLDGGGEIIIADKEGFVNPLLTALGSPLRVLPGNLSSLERDHADPRIFRARVTGNATLFAGIETLLVNHPAMIQGGVPLLETSLLAWDDTTGDGRPGGTESFKRRAICAREGNITALGDPSLFINAMLPENPELIKNLRGHPVLIDAVHSRTGTRNPIINTLTWIQATPLARAAIAVLAILPVAYLFGRKRE
ncbi:MAG: DUF4350 domain-containing protein [Methanomicrobiales archaeon]|nr:DUF4350 domain-containing protein [Methanomicrobiales archaeon]